MSGYRYTRVDLGGFWCTSVGFSRLQWKWVDIGECEWTSIDIVSCNDFVPQFQNSCSGWLRVDVGGHMWTLVYLVGNEWMQVTKVYQYSLTIVTIGWQLSTLEFSWQIHKAEIFPLMFSAGLRS